MMMEELHSLMKEPQPAAMDDAESAMEESVQVTEFTSARVEQVVAAMYCGNHPDPQAEAFLLQAQSSPAAWAFSWDLLQPTKGLELQFFGAKCLHTKVCENWHDLKTSHRNQLSELLKGKLLQYQNAVNFAVSKLHQVMAAVAIQQKAVDKDAPNPVQYVLSLFDSCENPQNDSVCLAKLSILTMVPEELKNLKLLKKTHMEIHSALQAALPQVLGWLKNLLAMDTRPEEQRWNHVLACFRSWLIFRIEPDDLMAIMDYVFVAMRSLSTLHVAVDITVKVFDSPSIQRYPQTLYRLFEQLNGLRPLADICLQQKDMDTVNRLGFVMVEAAEKNCSHLAEMLGKGGRERDTAIALLENIMGVGFPPGHFVLQEEVSVNALGFWQTLQDEMKERSSDDHTGAEMRELMTCVYRKLLGVLLTKVQYPDDYWLNHCKQEELEEFDKYRQEICDTMVCCYDVLREEMLQYLCQSLQALKEKNMEGGDPTWQELEAILTVFVSVGEVPHPPDSPYVSMVMRTLHEMPFCSPVLLSTALSLISVFHDWLIHHDDITQAVFPIILHGLRDRKVMTFATKTLSDFVRGNLLSKIPSFIPAILHTAQEVLKEEWVSEGDCMRLVGCVGCVLAFLPVPDLQTCLSDMLFHRLQLMRQLLTVQQQTQVVECTLVSQTKVMSHLFDSLRSLVGKEREEEDMEDEQRQKCSVVCGVLQQIFPVSKDMVNNWKTSPAVIEVVCELVMKSMKFLKQDTKDCSMAISVAEMTVDMYGTMPHEASLKLFESMVMEFDKDVYFSESIILLINTMVGQTLQSLERIQEDPLLLAHFNQVMANLLLNSATMKVKEGINLQGVLHIGVNSLKAPHAHVVCCSGLVVGQFLHLSVHGEPHFKRIVHNNMRFIVSTVMGVICSQPVASIVESLTKVFQWCCEHQLASFTHALRQCLSQDLPSCQASDQDKEHFVHLLTSNSRDKVKCQELVTEFTLKCHVTRS